MVNYKCYICNKTFTLETDIVTHLRKEEKIYIPEPKERAFYKKSYEINISNVNLKLNEYNDNEHKDFVVRTIHKYNYYEPLISVIFLKLLTKNDIFFDIGGNIGYYSLLTSQNCKEVHSFEPLYENYSKFEQNISINNIDNIIINKNIVSDEEHSMTFSYGTSHIDDYSNTPKIKNVILDNYIQINRLDEIKLIKIDVEGHEECVLNTMTKSLQTKTFQYIMCEVTNKTCRNIINTLITYGYNKIYNLNTGFILSNLNATSCMEINDILELYIISDISSFNDCNTNLLFTFN
jgi:FkbM family methyltransferase